MPYGIHNPILVNPTLAFPDQKKSCEPLVLPLAELANASFTEGSFFSTSLHSHPTSPEEAHLGFITCSHLLPSIKPPLLSHFMEKLSKAHLYAQNINFNIPDLTQFRLRPGYDLQAASAALRDDLLLIDKGQTFTQPLQHSTLLTMR